jgi:hypothetical protein
MDPGVRFAFYRRQGTDAARSAQMTWGLQCLVLTLVLGPMGMAQEASSDQNTTAPSASQISDKSSSQNDSRPNQQAKGGDDQRIFGIMPSYSITNSKDAAPLTARGKFKIFVQNTTDPLMPVGAALVAGIEQATNEFPSFGQGAAGYGKRFGTALADSSIGEFIGTFLFPTIFHEDPRYFREGEGPTGKRLGHALSSAFIRRRDSGRRGFAWSIVLGELAAGAISNAYYPSENRGVGLTFSRAAIGIGLGTVGTIFNEFGPDIQRKMSRKEKAKPEAAE